MHKKKLYIRTYGCQMNVYDSERMADLALPLGYHLCESPDEADLVIFNTCHIREKAAEKLYSDLGRIAPLKRRRAERSGAPMLLAVAGCVGQAEGEHILRRAPYVDMVLGPQSYHRLPEMIGRALRDGGHAVALDFAPEEKFDRLPETCQSQGKAAFLSVQEGCDKFCTFCVVPYTRGAEFSRPVAAVLREARHLVEESGVVELTLLGQNVNAYHGEDEQGREISLAGLIRRLAAVEGLARIRYTTSHPCDMTDELIALHGEEPKLMPYLHLPVQSGSDRILQRMNRRHKAQDYLQRIAQLRAVRSDMAISSDFIVGFPGETEEDFTETLALVEQVEYASAFSFAYSPRPGTPAAEAEQVPEPLRAERLQRLQKLLNRQRIAFNARTVGRVLPVLLERPGKYPGQLIGKSPYMQSVCMEGAGCEIGDLLTARITAAHANSLSGVPEGKGAADLNGRTVSKAAWCVM